MGERITTEEIAKAVELADDSCKCTHTFSCAAGCGKYVWRSDLGGDGVHWQGEHWHLECAFDAVLSALSEAQAERERLTKQIEQFWQILENCWEIEPRKYFEEAAPRNGFGSPLAMAVHYMWKREVRQRPSNDSALMPSTD